MIYTKVLLDNKKVKEIENYYKKCADDGAIYEDKVVDLEMFVEVFKKIGDNLNCIAGYYEEMATFVSDYD